MNLCVIYEHPKMLLGRKKYGFAKGVWNSFGGKVKEGESIEASAVRELKEESGLDAEIIEKRAEFLFDFDTGDSGLEVHLFHVKKYKGEPTETEEMLPRWFHVDELPFAEMWPDDRYWIPLFLAGKKFKGRFLFDKPSGDGYQAKILEKELIEVEEI